MLNKKVTSDRELIEELDAIQRITGVLDCDLSEILGITSSYLSVTRRRVKMSSFVKPKVEYVVKTLQLYQKSANKPIFRKHLAESTTQYKIRRKKLVSSFKEVFQSILENVDKKG